MSRLIKFRVWDSASKKMISNEFIEKFRLFGLVFITPDPTFSMQYTGINDKNGVEIYEDDIVEDYEGRLCRVNYANGCFYSVLISDDCIHELLSDNSSLCEVIGNIHENPELLED